jgi:thymidylate synthase ThyX
VAYSARVLLDSVAPNGVRLTTLEVTFPRFVLAEFNTHRSLSRNSASSRAVPTAKLIERVEQDPVLPLEWGRNKAGMSAAELLCAQEAQAAREIWLRACDAAVTYARQLVELKVHKQELNRILEPFLWHTVIVTATEWSNFFELRCSPNAQPEIREAALRMRDAMSASTTEPVSIGEWHTPLLQPDEYLLDLETRKKISAARCARVSYLTHEGRREIEKDLDLYERLKRDRHLSPFEHVATPSADAGPHANFRGWIQMRAEIEEGLEPRLQARRVAQPTSGV